MEEEKVEFETKTRLGNVIKWTTNDLGNSIYAMVIIGLIMNQYFLIVGQKEHSLSYSQADAIYNAIIVVMQLLVAISIPIMGALSDKAGKRKPLVVITTSLTLILTSLMGVWKNVYFIVLIFLLASFAFQASTVFYDAMLPFIAAPQDTGKVGAAGVAIGYIGTLVAYPIMIVLKGSWGTPISNITIENPTLEYGYIGRLETYLICVGLYLVLMIPFFFVNEKQKKSKIPNIKDLTKGAFNQVATTFKELRKHKELFKFAIGYFLVSDVTNIIMIKMFVILSDGIQLDTTAGIILVVGAAIIGIGCAFFIGRLADRRGAKTSYIVVCALWVTAMLLMIFLILFGAPIKVGFNLTFILVIIGAICIAIGQSGVVISQRAMIIELAPKEKVGEFFGFCKITGKNSSIISPIIWLVVFILSEPYWGFKEYSWAISAITILMMIGFAFIFTVKSNKKYRKENHLEVESVT
ncbi:MAG: MFS transporter [Asgard group archaeon]|nr:MFS transporter [Asgard group archaeon]